MVRIGKRRFVLGFLIVAAVGFTVAMTMFSSWSDVRSLDAAGAESSIAEVLSGPAGGPAYLSLAADGTVHVDRSLESEQAVKISSLNLMTWQPAEGRLARIDFPFWFVRAKLTDQVNLGTLTSIMARDWENLDLRVTEDDLVARGPGLVLDHTREDGARLILWME
ncbi:MAG: hypothetical protein GY711_02910 [bacterium]|nr:hypothetical protein [bacterium]